MVAVARYRMFCFFLDYLFIWIHLCESLFFINNIVPFSIDNTTLQ